VDCPALFHATSTESVQLSTPPADKKKWNAQVFSDGCVSGEIGDAEPLSSGGVSAANGWTV
jgi:hypothetical protein